MPINILLQILVEINSEKAIINELTLKKFRGGKTSQSKIQHRTKRFHYQTTILYRC